MPTDHRAALARIKRFDQLIAYLRDEMGWPIERIEIDELMFDYTPKELGIDTKIAATIEEIKRLRPLSANQPWGIFFVKFEPKRLPVIALRRILSQVVLKKRATAKAAEHPAWAADDLLFVSNYGEGDERRITFAHFSQGETRDDLPTLKVLGWDNLDTPLHLDDVAEKLTSNLAWPADEDDAEGWRRNWRSAFTVRHREAITTSRDLSIRLAQLARAIRDRIRTALSIETEQGPLTKLMQAFQEALIHDLDADYFADMYAQTIAYGLLSARIADPKSKTADDFANHMKTNPFLRELMATFLHVGGRRGKAGGPGIDFDELGVSEVVELLDDANMAAVVRDFGDKNPQEDPVIHFYELFLKEYDAKKRMQRGVFYTPRPLVSYIVRSVHELLRTEFGLADGLADTTTWGEMAERLKGLTIPHGVPATQPFVQVLDPATGTGTFLVEVIDLIHRTLVGNWKTQGHGDTKIETLWNEYVPKHLLPRLHGYELLMAPYAIAHLKIGLKLYETGYRFGTDERARIYLTNALEPASDVGQQTLARMFSALAHEAEAVNTVKRQQRFTIVVGNPPYSGHSANASKGPDGKLNFIGALIEDYKRDCPELFKPAQAKWLQDDYVKFLRFGQHLIQHTGVGTLGFITNHGYLDNPTFRGMRRSLMQYFGELRFLDLHGNSKKREVAPDGSKDENVFDIQQGVAACLLVRKAGTSPEPGHRLFHADLYGTRQEKYDALSADPPKIGAWERLQPNDPFYLFVHQDQAVREEYEQGWKVTEILSLIGDPAPGLLTTQDGFAISFTKSEAVNKVERLLATKTEAEARTLFRLCSQDQWVYARAKAELATGSWRKQVVKIRYRPFDGRWTVYNPYVAVHRRERVTRHMIRGANLGLHVVRQISIPEWRHVLATNSVTDIDYVSNLTSERGYVLPLYRYPTEKEAAMGLGKEPNLNPLFLRALIAASGLRFDLGEPPAGASASAIHREPWTEGAGSLRDDAEPFAEGSFSPEDVFHYIYGVLHSQTYRSRYAEFLKIDFPRIPLPGSADLFRAFAALGEQLVVLHLVESPLQTGISAAFDHATRRWRYDGADGMPIRLTFQGPEQPVVDKVSWSNDTVWIDKAQTIGFHNVPEAVWNFHIGGYQVCEKWLKDRKGRTLTADDIAHYQKIVVALAESIRLMKAIDEVIEAHGGWPAAFQGENTATGNKTRHPKEVSEPRPLDKFRTRNNETAENRLEGAETQKRARHGKGER